MRGSDFTTPKKKDWVPGDAQIGLYVRHPDGSVVSCLANMSDPATFAVALELVNLFATDLIEQSDKERLAHVIHNLPLRLEAIMEKHPEMAESVRTRCKARVEEFRRAAAEREKVRREHGAQEG